MVRIEITNSLLRVDKVTGSPRAPFERPKESLDFFVLELHSDRDVDRWCKKVDEALRQHASYLRRLSDGGAQLTLFIQYSGSPPVLRFEAWFVGALAAANVAVEWYHLDDDTDIV